MVLMFLYNTKILIKWVSWAEKKIWRNHSYYKKFVDMYSKSLNDTCCLVLERNLLTAIENFKVKLHGIEVESLLYH